MAEAISQVVTTLAAVTFKLDTAVFTISSGGLHLVELQA